MKAFKESSYSVFGALVAVVALSACKDEEKHTVDYFVANPEARAERLAQCEVQDDAADDANCRNAVAAEDQVKRDKSRDAIDSIYGKPSFD